MSETVHPMTQSHITEDSDLQEHCHKNLKSHINVAVEPAAIRYLADALHGIVCKNTVILKMY